MRLPAVGLTLPWQLVAAQEPGPIYLPGSFWARAENRGASNKTQNTSAGQRGVSALSIREIEKDRSLISERGVGSQTALMSARVKKRRSKNQSLHGRSGVGLADFGQGRRYKNGARQWHGPSDFAFRGPQMGFVRAQRC